MTGREKYLLSLGNELRLFTSEPVTLVAAFPARWWPVDLLSTRIRFQNWFMNVELVFIIPCVFTVPPFFASSVV
jgi:hypothetical protein